jgi:SWI/SNF-related matrix-associated actin-dependent regulator of chromatin subfamily A3
MLDLEVKLGNIVEASHRMSIMKSDEQFLVVFFDGTEMGQLNAQLEKAFDSIFQQQQHVDFEVFAPIKQIRETIGKSTKEKDAIVRVNINMYGNRDCAQQVGQQLSKHKVYLQRPDEVRAGLVYDNPHELKLKLPNVQLLYNNCEANTTTNEEVRTVSEKAEAFKKTISNVYSSLTRGQKLIGLEGDGRLKTQLLP